MIEFGNRPELFCDAFLQRVSAARLELDSVANHVGVAHFSSIDLGNGGNGLHILNSANNTIGGTAPSFADYNVFSGNGLNGVIISGATSSGNVFITNVFGTNGGLTDIDVGNDAAGLYINGAPNNTVHVSVISGNGTSGLRIEGATASGNVIWESVIGSDQFSTLDIGNNGPGVLIDGAPSNQIGLSSASGNFNLISGNGGDGVRITGAGATGNTVRGNIIGLQGNGVTPLVNGDGVSFDTGATGNTVGGFSASDRNIISGNSGAGVDITSNDNTVRGNYIGTDITGALDSGNGTSGVNISSASNSTIAGNVISGNSDLGVSVQLSANNKVFGNYIGLNATGSFAIGNTFGGVRLVDATNTLVGGATPGEGNVISGNGLDGLVLGNSLGANNTIAGNRIGTNAAGAGGIPNARDGIRLVGGAHDNLIGGAAGVGNTIAFNTGDGVHVDGAATIENAIRRNEIYSNGLKGIETINGGNNEPVHAPPSISTLIDGTLSGTSACATCEIDVFSDFESSPEGRTYEGSTTTDGGGAWSYTGPATGPKLTATVTDGAGNTSEFSGGFDIIIIGLAGTGTAGFNGDAPIAAAAALLNSPRGVFKHTDGVIYFADTDNNRIRQIATDGPRTVTTLAGSGTPPSCAGALGDNGPATSATLCAPRDVFVAPNGDVFIADTGQCRIRKVNGGTITTVAGNGTCGFAGDGGAASSAQLDSPRGIALDAAGNIYIADTFNNRVRKVDAATGVISTFAGGSGEGFSGDFLPAATARLNQPHDVYIALRNHLIIADTGNHKLRRVFLPTTVITTFAGNGTPGSSGDGGLAVSAQLNGPESVAADDAGNVYIADTQNNKIRRVTFDGTIFASGHLIVTVAGTGAPGSTGNGGAAILATLNKPAGVGIGTVIIGDEANNMLRVLPLENGRQPGGVRPATSCSQGSVANADGLLLLAPLGLVAFRRRVSWLATMLLAALLPRKRAGNGAGVRLAP